MLLVPPTGSAGSYVVFLRLLYSFMRLDLCGLRYISFFSFLLLKGLMKGVVWRGWMTSLLCACSVLSDAEGRGKVDERRTDGDATQGSKVPGGLLIAGRTWLCSSYYKLLRLPGECFVFVLPVIPLVPSLRVISNDTAVKTCQNSKVLEFWALKSCQKLAEQNSKSKFPKLANEGLGEYPKKSLPKNLLFGQIQISKICYFGKYFAKYASLEMSLLLCTSLRSGVFCF